MSEQTTAQNLTHALAAHGQWKSRLRQAIESGASELSADVASRDDRCDLGRWLASGASADEKASPHYAACRQAHTEFHRVAGQVLALALAGRRADAEARMGITGDFTKASAAITRELTSWHREVA